MLSKRHRISNRRLILKLSRQGKVYHTAWFVFKTLPAQHEDSQFAVSISKKAAKKAVERNRKRRQIYSSLRKYLNEMSDPVVCLVFLKKSAPESMPFPQIDAQIQTFINQLKRHV